MCVLEAGYSDFVGRCAVGRAVFNGFRKLLCSSKLYITAVILFSCIYTGFGGINGYLMRQGQTVQAGELFVFGMDSWIPQLIITVAFLILVNDIPLERTAHNYNSSVAAEATGYWDKPCLPFLQQLCIWYWLNCYLQQPPFAVYLFPTDGANR